MDQRDAWFRAGRPSGRFWLGVLLVWTAIGGLETLKTGVFLRLQGTPRSVPDLILLNMPWWYLWALLTPAIVWLAGRFPLEAGRWARHLPVHTLAGAVLATLHLSASATLMHMAGFRGAFSDLAAQVQWLINTYVVLDLLTYGGIVAVVTVVTLLGRLRDEELRAARLETRALRLEAGVTEARLHALERELDPHFLFNTLNTVSALARQGETVRLRTVLARLADLLRKTLDWSRGHEVPLHDELDMLDQYLEIERIRLGTRLTVDLRVEPEAAQALLPTFILQPLVENAIRHGIGPMATGGELTIHVTIEGRTLRVMVRNAQEIAVPRNAEWHEGVGLRNTRARLQQLYGDMASVEVHGRDSPEVSVTVRLPLRFGGSRGAVA